MTRLPIDEETFVRNTSSCVKHSSIRAFRSVSDILSHARLLERRALQPEAGNQLLCLGEWPIDHRLFVAREPDPRPLRAWLQSFACEQAGNARDDFKLLSAVRHG